MKSTFFYIRCVRNPVFYGFKDPKNFEVEMLDLVEKALMQLH